MIGRFGGPGPRQFRESTAETEIKNPTQAAMRILVAGFVIVLVSEVVLVLFHDVALPLVGMLISGFVGFVLVWFSGIDRSWGSLLIVGCVILGGSFALANSEVLWRQVDSGFESLQVAFVLFVQPVTVPVILIALIVWGILSRFLGFRVGTVLVMAALGLYCGSNPDPRFSGHLSGSWSVLRWFLLPWALPPVMASVIMILTMTKEMFLPALEHTLGPLKWDDYIKAGGKPWSLFFPVLEKPEHIPQTEDVMEVTIYGQRSQVPEMKRTLLPVPKRAGREGLTNFARDLLVGSAYWSRDGSTRDSVSGARNYGFTQTEWNALSKEFLRLGFSIADGRGTILTEIGIGFLAGLVARTLGRHVVPQKYHKYLSPPPGEDDRTDA